MLLFVCGKYLWYIVQVYRPLSVALSECEFYFAFADHVAGFADRVRKKGVGHFKCCLCCRVGYLLEAGYGAFGSIFAGVDPVKVFLSEIAGYISYPFLRLGGGIVQGYSVFVVEVGIGKCGGAVFDSVFILVVGA